MRKVDFPIFENNTGLVYLDSAASAQKPKHVIDGLKHYLENDYANIHRGVYELSEKSEELFWAARRKVAQRINARVDEIIFTANSTDASNKLVQSLVGSGLLKKGDIIALGEGEHHANIVPWQIACEQIGCEIIRIGVDSEGGIDLDALEDILTEYPGVRCVGVSHISNVTGTINDCSVIKKMLPESCLLVVDASQSVAHLPVDVEEIDCDFLRFTGHKIGAMTGVGVLFGKKKHLRSMKPATGGGGAVASVGKDGYSLLGAPDKFEPGTPNLTGVISLLYAFEYMEMVGEKLLLDEGSVLDDSSTTTREKQCMVARYSYLNELEDQLVSFSLKKFEALSTKGVQLVGSMEKDKRIGVFSFLLPKNRSINGLAEYMADHKICIRCGAQCAHPLHVSLGKKATCRMSLRIYNDMSDLEVFFQTLETFMDLGG